MMRSILWKATAVAAACIAALAFAVEGTAYGVETATLVGKSAKTFSTAGHPKSKGIELTISYPADWSAEETGGKTVVQMLVNPTSTATMTIGIKPTKRPVTNEEAAKLVATREGVAPLFPSTTSILDFHSIKVGETPAALVECTDSREQAGGKVHARSFFLVFLQGDILVMLHCMAASPDSAAVEKTFEAHRELYKQMLGSVVLGKGLK